MNTVSKRILSFMVIAIVAISVSVCSNMTGESSVGTVGGAAIGGIIGHQVGK